MTKIITINWLELIGIIIIFWLIFYISAKITTNGDRIKKFFKKLFKIWMKKI